MAFTGHVKARKRARVSVILLALFALGLLVSGAFGDSGQILGTSSGTTTAVTQTTQTPTDTTSSSTTSTAPTSSETTSTVTSTDVTSTVATSSGPTTTVTTSSGPASTTETTTSTSMTTTTTPTQAAPVIGPGGGSVTSLMVKLRRWTLERGPGISDRA